jgi:hypothetical protein
MEKHVAAALLSLLRSLFRFTSLFLWLRIIHFSKPTATHRTYCTHSVKTSILVLYLTADRGPC